MGRREGEGGLSAWQVANRFWPVRPSRAVAARKREREAVNTEYYSQLCNSGFDREQRWWGGSGILPYSTVQETPIHRGIGTMLRERPAKKVFCLAGTLVSAMK